MKTIIIIGLLFFSVACTKELITVNQKPIVSISASKTSINTDELLSINAQTSGVDTVSYNWYVNGSSEGIHVNVLQFKKSIPGNYTILCRAYSHYWVAEDSIKINVLK